MYRVAFFLTVLFLALPGMAFGAYTLDYSGETDLKMIFDSGLRPWRQPGGLGTCKIGPEDILILTPDGKRFEFPVAQGAFTILRGGKIYKSDLSGAVMSNDAATKLMERILTQLGIDDDAFIKFANKYNSPGPLTEDYWSQAVEYGNLSLFIVYRPYPDPKNSLAAINISITKSFDREKESRIKAPLQPPVGYEHVSMDPPPRKVGGVPFPPMEFEDYVKAGRAFSSGQSLVTNQRSFSNSDSEERERAKSSAAESSWLSIFFAVVSIVGLAIFALFRISGRKRNT